MTTLHGEDAEDLGKRGAAGVILHEGGSTAAIRWRAAVGAAGAEHGPVGTIWQQARRSVTGAAIAGDCLPHLACTLLLLLSSSVCSLPHALVSPSLDEQDATGTRTSRRTTRQIGRRRARICPSSSSRHCASRRPPAAYRFPWVRHLYRVGRGEGSGRMVVVASGARRGRAAGWPAPVPIEAKRWGRCTHVRDLFSIANHYFT